MSGGADDMMSTAEHDERDRAARIAYLESAIADNASLGIVERHKARMELAHLLRTTTTRRTTTTMSVQRGGGGTVAQTARRVEEHVRAEHDRQTLEREILERQATLRNAAAERRGNARLKSEEAAKRSRAADDAVTKAEEVVRRAIAASRKAVEELAVLREAAGRERTNVQRAEKEFEELARLEHEIERGFEDDAGEEGGGHVTMRDGGASKRASDETHGDRDDNGEEEASASAVLIAGMESELRDLARISTDQWKEQCEALARRCAILEEEAALDREVAAEDILAAEAAFRAEADELTEALERAIQRAEKAEALNELLGRMSEQYERVLERKKGELARVESEAEEAIERAVKEAEEAARASQEVAAANREAEADQLTAMLEQITERAEKAEAENLLRGKINDEYERVLERKNLELARVKSEAEDAVKEAEEAAESAAKQAWEEAKATAKRDAEAKAMAAEEAAKKEEEQEKARREEEEAAYEAANNHRLIVLISRGVADVQQRSDQRHALRLLNDLRVPHEVVDGMDDGVREPEAMGARDALFRVSGVRGNYPQLFRVTANGRGDVALDDDDDGEGGTVHLGGLAWLERADPDDLRGTFPAPPGGWDGADDCADSRGEVARLSRRLKEERESAARENEKLRAEIEELEETMIQASGMLEAEQERARGLEAELARRKGYI